MAIDTANGRKARVFYVFGDNVHAFIVAQATCDMRRFHVLGVSKCAYGCRSHRYRGTVVISSNGEMVPSSQGAKYR